MGNKKMKLKFKKMKHLIIMLLLSFPVLAFSQQGTVSAGGDIVGEAGSMSFSTGQTDFFVITSETHNLQFGLQQLFAPAQVSTDPFQQQSPGFFKLYPNPTSGRFIIEFFNFPMESDARIEIYGMQGNLIERKELSTGWNHTLSLEGQRPGIYLIRVLYNEMVGIDRILKQ
jgi:hypothetical protein